MLSLQIVAVLIAWASATFGIWSSKEINRKVAWIATLITSLGLVVGIALAVISSIDGKKARAGAVAQQTKLEAQLSKLRLALTGTELTSLEINWVFSDVPQGVMDIFAIGAAIEHAERLSDDEIDRLADRVLTRIRKAWHVASVLRPLVGIISTGETDLYKLFEGDVSDAINAFGPNAPDIQDPDKVWFSVSYKAPTYDIVFPLNMQHSAALVLGRVNDAPLSDVNENHDGPENLEVLHAPSKYDFEAAAQPLENGFVLHWKYDSDALLRNSVGIEQVTAAFPATFRIISLQLESKDYAEILRDEPLDQLSENDRKVDTWMQRSEITVIVNGIEEAAITYTVDRVGVRDRMIEFSKYDAPYKQYEYTLFNASLKLSVAEK
ncbi:MAG: hypothetical protein ACYTEL_12655 [Planctomycetota bacterium]|jgi:hypothetical protein